MSKSKSLIVLIDECLDLTKSDSKWKKHDFNYALVNIKTRLEEVRDRIKTVNETLTKLNNRIERISNNERNKV